MSPLAMRQLPVGGRARRNGNGECGQRWEKSGTGNPGPGPGTRIYVDKSVRLYDAASIDNPKVGGVPLSLKVDYSSSR